MRRGWFLMVGVWMPLACGPVCGADGLETGGIQATIDGEDWQGAGTSWMWSGDGLHINSTRTDGWMFTARLMSTVNGKTIREAAESGSMPLEVSLDSAGLEGWMALYPEEGGSFITKNDQGGTVLISELDDSVVVACFDFMAEAGNGTTMEITSGSMLAEVMP